MSFSPPSRRLSVSSMKDQEDLINAYEAEEERIVNVLSRKLEQLREQKIDLENTLEAESESHVNRLSRELSKLRLVQQQLQAHQNSGANPNHGSVSVSPDTRLGFRAFMSEVDPGEPSVEVMLETMRRENEQLRNKLVDTERDYIRVMRLNEIFREELIDHRTRLGLSVDNLVGLSSAPDALSQPTHRRPQPSFSGSSSPSTSVVNSSVYLPRPTPGVPIPRPPSQIHRPINNIPSETTTPLSHSPSSSDTPFPFSPIASTNPESFLTASTNITSPPSSLSYNVANALSQGTIPRALSYPSVPPPSLSSSFGSPNISYHMPHRDHSLSPVEPLSRRNSNATRMGVNESGNFRTMSHTGSRRASVDRGARVAETGSLLTRPRGASQNLPVTPEMSGLDTVSQQCDGIKL